MNEILNLLEVCSNPINNFFEESNEKLKELCSEVPEKIIKELITIIENPNIEEKILFYSFIAIRLSFQNTVIPQSNNQLHFSTLES